MHKHLSSNQSMLCFFISYNRNDEEWAKWIAYILEDAGHETIVQAWDFRPGGNFVLDMQYALEKADKTIAVLSDNYLSSSFTQPEWAAVFAKDPKGLSRDLIPIRIQKCKPKGLLAPIQYVDLVGLDREPAQKKILEMLQERIKPKEEPTYPGLGIAAFKSLIKQGQRSQKDFIYLEYVPEKVGLLNRINRRKICSIEQRRAFVDQIDWQISGQSLEMNLIPVTVNEDKVAERGSALDKSHNPLPRITKPFYLGKYPVTQEQWRAVADLSGGELKLEPSFFSGKNRPVERVTWHDANRYCQMLSDLTERVFRLPREREWEYACRAGTATPSPYDSAHNQLVMITEEEWTREDSKRCTHDVYEHELLGDVFLPNGFGLYHMLGNVAEWCLDFWDYGKSQEPPESSVHLQPKSERKRVTCGGSFMYARDEISFQSKGGEDADSEWNYVGFRVLMEVN